MLHSLVVFKKSECWSWSHCQQCAETNVLTLT